MSKAFIILSLFLINIPLFAQKSPINSLKVDVTISTPTIFSTQIESQVLQESQRLFDRSLSVFGLVFAATGILLATLTILLAILAAFGFLEYRKLKNLRKEANLCVTNANSCVEEIKPIVDAIKKQKEIAEKYSKEIFQNAEDFSKEISPEIKLKLNEMQEAISALKVLGMPPLPAQHLNRATYFYFEKDYPMALEYIDKAIELTPDCQLLWGNKGYILEKLGRIEESLQYFEKVLKSTPNDFKALTAKGAVLLKLNKFSDAKKSLNAALEINQKDILTWVNMGVAVAEAIGPKEAHFYFDKALELDGDKYAAWVNKGSTFLKMNLFDDAIKCYQRAIAISPEDSRVFLVMASAYAEKGDKDNTLTALRKAIQFDTKCKQMAKQDEDFKKFFDDPDFQKLVG